MGKNKKSKGNKGGNASGSEDGGGGQAPRPGGATKQPPSGKQPAKADGNFGGKAHVPDVDSNGSHGKIKEVTAGPSVELGRSASTESPGEERDVREIERTLSADGMLHLFPLSSENGNSSLKDGEKDFISVARPQSGRSGENAASVKEADGDLRKELMQERETVLTLRKQLSSLEEQAALRDVNEAATLAEIRRLREENGQIAGEVSSLRESMEKLEAEKKQLAAKLAAVQTGMQQLEREASIRARVQQDLAEATTDQPKSWWGGGKDPIAEAAALAEEARVQKAAAASMVDKLLEENADLTERLNEQSSLIDRLARRYSALAERVEDGVVPATAGESPLVVSRSATPRVGGPPPGWGEEVTDPGQMAGPAPFVMVDTAPSSSNTDNNNNTPADTPVNNGKGPARTARGEVAVVIEPSAPRGQWQSEIEELPAENGAGYPSKFASNGGGPPPAFRRTSGTETAAPAPTGVPFSDSPIMGAPIRVVSFLARFVTGEDLVKKR